MKPRHCCLLLLVLLLFGAGLLQAAERRYFTEAKAEGGELRYVNELPVLFLSGAPDEMGRQRGALSGEAAKAVIEFPVQMLKAVGAEAQLPRLLKLSQQLLPQFPPDHAAELRAFARRSGMAEDLCLGGNTLVDLYRGKWGCSSLIVEGGRSQTGQPLFARNLDFPAFGLLDKYNLVVVQRPKGKRAFVSVAWPGLIGVFSGINESGLCVAVHNVYHTADGAPMLDLRGVPYSLCFRRMLEDCQTVGEAEKLLRELPRTTMLNLGVCDLKSAAVFELTPKTVQVRRAERGLLPCTNHFRSEGLCVAKSCWRYGQLDKAQGEGPFSVADLEKKLHAVNQGLLTVQSMVFEPGAMRLHVSVGRPPVSDGPYRTLNVKELLETKP